MFHPKMNSAKGKIRTALLFFAALVFGLSGGCTDNTDLGVSGTETVAFAGTAGQVSALGGAGEAGASAASTQPWATGVGGNTPVGGSSVGSAGSTASWAGASGQAPTGAAGKAGGAGGATGGSGAAAGSSASAGNGGIELGCPEQLQSGTPTTIFVVGDSTASIYGQDVYPRMGWAQVLDPFFATACAKVQDKAISGRSSKSFYDEGSWAPVTASIKTGDYVMIQFAHNDEKSEDAARYTDPATTFPEYLTKYIEESRAKGGIPILLTPLNRNKWNGTVLTNSHGAYPDAIRKLAREKSTPLVDVTALTKTYFEEIGPAETTKLFLSGDTTHLQETGAKIVSQIVVADLYQQALPIAALLAAVPTMP